MDLERIDLICIFDFELDLHGSALRKLLASVPSHLNQAVARYSTSFDWLFIDLLLRSRLLKNPLTEVFPRFPASAVSD